MTAYWSCKPIKERIMFEYFVSFSRRCSNDYYDLEQYYMTDKEIQELLLESPDDICNIEIYYNDFRQVENLTEDWSVLGILRDP